MSQRDDAFDAMIYATFGGRNQGKAWATEKGLEAIRRAGFQPNRIRPAPASIGALEARKGPDGVWAVEVL